MRGCGLVATTGGDATVGAGNRTRPAGHRTQHKMRGREPKTAGNRTQMTEIELKPAGNRTKTRHGAQENKNKQRIFSLFVFVSLLVFFPKKLRLIDTGCERERLIDTGCVCVCDL